MCVTGVECIHRGPVGKKEMADREQKNVINVVSRGANTAAERERWKRAS